MPWAAAAAVAGAALGANATSRASRRQQSAADRQLAEQARQYDLTREDQRPYREAGYAALERLSGLTDFDPTPTHEAVFNEPGYQFGLLQGRNAVEGSAAARGGLYSGNALKELMQFGNDYATTKYGDAWNRAHTAFGNRWNRLAGLAGIGQTANQQTQQAGQHYADAAGNIMGGAANAAGAAGMARANIWGNALNQVGSWARNRDWGGTGTQSGIDTSIFRADDPYRNAGYVGGDWGE